MYSIRARSAVHQLPQILESVEQQFAGSKDFNYRSGSGAMESRETERGLRYFHTKNKQLHVKDNGACQLCALARPLYL